MADAELLTQQKAKKRQLKSALTRHSKIITEYKPSSDQQQGVDEDILFIIKEYEVAYAQLIEVYDKLYLHIAEDDDTTFDALTKDQDASLQQYLRIMKIIRVLRPSATPFSTEKQPSSSATPVPVKLPQLDLPKFGGAVEEWFHFKDLFASLINDNSAVTDSQRFQYLKASLYSDAAECISELPTTDINYKVAWDLLTARFENKHSNAS